jgi:cytochrome P450
MTKVVPRLREWPLLGSLLTFQKNRLALFKRIANECGEIGSFSVGPYRMTFINSPALIHGMLVEHAANFIKGKKVQFFKKVLGQNSLVTIDGTDHRRQRKLHAPAFQYKRLSSYAIPIVDFTHDLQKSWKDGERLDLGTVLTHLTQRIIRKALFGLDGLADDDGFTDALGVAEGFLEYMSSHLFPLPMNSQERRLGRAVLTMRQSVRSMIELRQRTGGDHGDLLSMLLLARDENGAGLTDDQVMDHALTLYMAGHETSAMALTWVFLELARHPEIAAKVQQEVDAVLKGRKPTLGDLINLPFTLQVIKETLRLYPVSYTGGRTPTGDVEIAGYPFKGGEPVLFSAYTLHRNPELYPDPERFDPERFRPENEKKLPRGAYLPFSAGPHVCIGAQFAMMEMHLIVAHLAQHVTLSLEPGQDIQAVPVVVLRPNSSRMIVQRRNQ